MKKLIVSILLAIVCIQFSSAQNSASKKVYFKPGISFGVGIFYPKEVNNYIENDLTDYITTNENLYANYFLGVSFGIQLNKVIAIEPVIEFALAPKIMIGADRTYIFGRVSPGVMANLYAPMGSKGRNAFMLGGGILYHHMWFEDYAGNTIGPAFKIGVSFNHGKSFNPEAFAGFNYAKAMGKYSGGGYFQQSELELSYTDFRIGFRANFKI
jgi:hypothetical protein